MAAKFSSHGPAPNTRTLGLDIATLPGRLQLRHLLTIILALEKTRSDKFNGQGLLSNAVLLFLLVKTFANEPDSIKSSVWRSYSCSASDGMVFAPNMTHIHVLPHYLDRRWLLKGGTKVLQTHAENVGRGRNTSGRLCIHLIGRR